MAVIHTVTGGVTVSNPDSICWWWSEDLVVAIEALCPKAAMVTM